MEIENIVANTVYIKARESKCTLIDNDYGWRNCAKSDLSCLLIRVYVYRRRTKERQEQEMESVLIFPTLLSMFVLAK